MRKLIATVLVLCILPLGFRCDREPPTKERPCLTCAEADTITDNYFPLGMDTVYWEVYKVDTIVDRDCYCADKNGNLINCPDYSYHWQRRTDRWVCKVDRVFIDTICSSFPEDKDTVYVCRYDTTWIPLAPVFIDTTMKNDAYYFHGTYKWDEIGAAMDSAVDRAYRRMQGEK